MTDEKKKHLWIIEWPPQVCKIRPFFVQKQKPHPCLWKARLTRNAGWISFQTVSLSSSPPRLTLTDHKIDLYSFHSYFLKFTLKKQGRNLYTMFMNVKMAKELRHCLMSLNCYNTSALKIVDIFKFASPNNRTEAAYFFVGVRQSNSGHPRVKGELTDRTPVTRTKQC